jgi:hemolysin III
MFKRLREPVSGLMHLGTAIAAVLGLAALLWLGRSSLAKEISLLIYGLSLVLMFSASSAYHLIQSNARVVQWLRKLDHSAIYVLIAGTYTPICLHFFDGFWRWGMLGIIWGMALIGVTVKLFVIKAPRWITAGVYLIMGWLSIAAIQEMVRAIPVGALVWLFAGGLFFTIGAIIYVTKKLDFVPGVFGFHEVWHIFVILGCASHFIVIAAFVAPFAAPA